MAASVHSYRKSRLESRAQQRAEYKILFAASFVLFFIGSLIARAAGLLRLPFVSRRTERKSLVAEARDAANSVLPYAFMG